MQITPAPTVPPPSQSIAGYVYEPRVPEAGTRPERIAALKQQREEVLGRIAPDLERLQRDRIIGGYELLWLDGQLGIEVPTGGADRAIEALREVESLRHVEFGPTAPLVIPR